MKTDTLILAGAVLVGGYFLIKKLNETGQGIKDAPGQAAAQFVGWADSMIPSRFDVFSKLPPQVATITSQAEAWLSGRDYFYDFDSFQTVRR